MNEQLAIYLWSISSHIIGGAFIIGTVCSVIILVLIIDYSCRTWYSDKQEKEYLENELIPSVKKIGIIAIIAWSLFLFIPNKQDLALILLYPHIKSGAEATLQSATAKKMMEVVDLYLDNTIKDLKQ